VELHLDQSAIEAMFAAAAQAEAEAAKQPEAALSENGEHRPKPEMYNFSHARQISNEQMRAISTVNDLFARNLTHNLGAWLRSQFQVTMVSGEQMLYAEYLERVPELAYVCSARLEPLDALGVVQMDLSLAPPIVDLLLGGVGRAGPMREPTDIESEILLSVMEIVIRELNVAWQPVGLKFSIEKREPTAQVSRLMPVAEKTLCVSFEIRMPEAQGTLNLCLPAVVLNTILRRLIADGGRPRRRSTESRTRLTDLLGETSYGAVLKFPNMRLSARELGELAPGKLLRLPLQRNAMAELRVGGLPLFCAQPVRSGEHRGAQVKGYSPDAERPIAT
jgi:flagellar motor switch protein FliM